MFINYNFLIGNLKSNLNELYNISPIFLQNLACNLKGIYINQTRYDKQFRKELKEFCKRERWNQDEICSYRDKKIRDLVRHCYETVPYYRNLFEEKDILPSDIKGLDDLRILPLLNKDIINANPQIFISNKAKQYKTIHAHTSGSTGAGFNFLTTYESLHAQWAAYWRLYLKSGIRFGEKQGTFSGQLIVPVKQKNPPFWRSVLTQRRVYFSAYHEKDDTLFSYYKEIERSGIKWLSGYPSLIALLADFIIRNSLDNPGIKYVTTGAENLYGFQEKNIKKAFKGARFAQVYGQAENVAIITQGINNVKYIDEDAAAVELISNDSGSYDIVGTNLYNYAMPLLRYETKDMATFRVDSNGRREILSLDGRKEDYISLPDGRKIGRIDYAFKNAVHIRESQIYQKIDYSVEIRVVLNDSDGVEEAEQAKRWLEKATNNSVLVTIKYVDVIKRTNTCKLRYVISEIENKKEDIDENNVNR